MNEAEKKILRKAIQNIRKALVPLRAIRMTSYLGAQLVDFGARQIEKGLEWYERDVDSE